ncbi:ectonucleotide pyrophosphatase/phosphodiesterase [Phenylobacterium hankyongense]|nr:ectonucleotide pyrophosphatase/phosphodiesterase [Phenylobacterium hankyongense]
MTIDETWRGLVRWAGAALAAAAFVAAGPVSAAPAHHKVLVVSVDGLDWRYLRDRDQLHLAIPNLRRLMGEGWTADGVIGVWPTVTWPSHTSILTGLRPDQHGVLGNQRPKEEGGDYYWTPSFIHGEPLWACAADAGLTTASVTWPVTKDAKITWDLPEYFRRRNGGSMDLATAASDATPGLVEGISAMFPSFPQQWIDDRTRTQAVLYLLKTKRPDLILLHLVDLDSEAHDQGPFEVNANAVMERTDALIGELARALPADYDLVVTSDHGFERLDHIANLGVLMAEAGVKGDLQPMGGVVVARDQAAAGFLRGLAAKGQDGLGREIPPAELARYAPKLAGAIAAFEPAPHYMFGRAETGPYLTAPRERGEHGFWPLRSDYRSIYIASGPGVPPGLGPTIEMVSLKARLAGLMGLHCRD